jgi:hypothetical protein
MDPDPAFQVNPEPDPDPAFQVNPDTGIQGFDDQKLKKIQLTIFFSFSDQFTCP